MAKVQILGIQTGLEPTLTSVQRLGVLQIEDASVSTLGLDRLPRDPEVEEQRQVLTSLLAQLEAVLSALPRRHVTIDEVAYAAATAEPSDALAARLRAELKPVTEQVRTLTARREKLVEEQLSLPRYEATIRQLMPLTSELPVYERFETVALLIDRRFEDVLGPIRRELARLTQEQIEMVAGVVDAETVAAILVFPREYSSEINQLLGREHISRVRLPEELAGVPFHRVLAATQSRLEALPREIADMDRQLEARSDEWYMRLATYRAVLRDRLNALNVRGRLAATEYTFVLVGWVPERDLAMVQETLQAEVGDEIVVTQLPLSLEEQEEAPVVLKNPAAVQPFESLIRLLALPRYGEVDPTPLMAFFMPLFFGMILGDIAYGLAVVALALWLRRRPPPQSPPPGGKKGGGLLRDLGSIFLFGGAWSVVFGFLYGELFGTFGETLGLHPVLDRAHALIPLFAMAIAMGILQVFLGLILGVWGAVRERHLGEVGEKVGALVGLVAVFALLGVVAGRLPEAFFTPFVVLLLVGIVLLSVPMGLIGVLLGPLELLGTIGNILSYLRIAAIGLSSVYLAMVANEMAGLMGNIVLGAVVAGLFHVLNIALGIVSPTIQALRLHYVEFFSKFYEGGGRPFTPFRRESV
jgi:V/A-type H+-transporting ATPase subunit I